MIQTKSESNKTKILSPFHLYFPTSTEKYESSGSFTLNFFQWSYQVKQKNSRKEKEKDKVWHNRQESSPALTVLGTI